jgi:thymidylate synthase
MKTYLDLVQHVMDNGSDRKERTWVGTRSVFWAQVRYDLNKWFPLLTTKKVFLKAIIHELLWFIRGDTNIKYLVDNWVGIWNERAFTKYLKWNNLENKRERYSDERKNAMKEFAENIKNDQDFADKRWELWPVYGKQWRAWETKDWKVFDQVQNIIDMLKNDRNSRRIIISWWNAGEIEELIHSHDFAPPPCHTLFQFHVIDNKLSLQLYQRSADIFLWVPFNLASYALFTMMVAQVAWLEVWEFIHTFWDLHIYHNHFDQVKEQLSRTPRDLPTMKINPDIKSIFDFKYEDFQIEWYNPHDRIKAPIAV